MNDDLGTKSGSQNGANSPAPRTRHGSGDTDPEADRFLLEWHRELPTWRKVEMIRGLCRSVQELNLAYLRRWSASLGVTDLLDQALREAGLAT